MGAPMFAPERFASSFKSWFLKERIEQIEGPETRGTKAYQQPWWKVVCLTRVDYFSTLGYIPGITALARASPGAHSGGRKRPEVYRGGQQRR